MNRDRSGLDVLTRAQCLHLLSSARIGRLAFHSGAVPVILPVAFAVDEDAIVVRVDDGSRLDAGTRDAVVAFEADGGDPSRRGWSVSVTGTTSDVSDPRELSRSRALLPDWSDGGGDRVVRISIELMSGRRGSPESTAAMDAVVGLLGARIGRLTVATVAPFGDVKLKDRQARAGLGRLVGRIPGREPTLEVLHGHPSAALRQCATEAGYDLVVVGTRGAGITKTILGRAASELARDCKVPVLLVGGGAGA